MYKISFTSGVVLILIDQFFPYISSLFNVFCIITFFPWILPIWPPASHDSEICARTQIRKRSLLNWYSLCNFSTIYRCFPKLLAPNIPWVSRKHYVEAAQGRFPQLFFPRESLNKTLKKTTHPPKVFTDWVEHWAAARNIVREEYRGGALEGNKCRALLKSACDLGRQLPTKYKVFAVALAHFNKVVTVDTSCNKRMKHKKAGKMSSEDFMRYIWLATYQSLQKSMQYQSMFPSGVQNSSEDLGMRQSRHQRLSIMTSKQDGAITK